MDLSLFLSYSLWQSCSIVIDLLIKKAQGTHCDIPVILDTFSEIFMVILGIKFLGEGDPAPSEVTLITPVMSRLRSGSPRRVILHKFLRTVGQWLQHHVRVLLNIIIPPYFKEG